MLNRRFEYGRRDIWLLRGIAMVFSIFLWIAVIGGKKDEIKKAVRLEFRLSEGLVVANQLPGEIVFRVRGPRVFLRELETRDLTIPVNLLGAKVGELEVNMTDDLLDLPLGLEVVDVHPRKFKLQLDQVAKKRVTVRPVLSNNLPDGFRVAQITANPSTIEVRGPQKNLRYINSLPTEELAVTTSSLKQEFDAEMNLSDFPGVQVTEGVDTIYVVAELEGPTARKRLSNIVVRLKLGTGKSSRQIDPNRINASIRPRSVTFVMEGTEAALKKLKARDINVWAEIPSSESGRYRTKILWSLPPELRVLRRSTDYVEVVVR